MLFLSGAKDMAAYAEARPLSAQPGSQFQYSTATSLILSDIMTRALTSSEDPQVRRAAMMQFIRGRFIRPLGMSSLTLEFHARGPLSGGSYITAPARDYARFGEFPRRTVEAHVHETLPVPWL